MYVSSEDKKKYKKKYSFSTPQHGTVRTGIFSAVRHEVEEHLIFPAIKIGFIEEVAFAEDDQLEVVQQRSRHLDITRSLLAQVHYTLAG